jgi:hypothetical protein
VRLSKLLLELCDDPTDGLESFIYLLVLTATLGRSSGADEESHLFENFAGSE